MDQDELKQLVSVWLVAHENDAPRWNIAAVSDTSDIPYHAFYYWLCTPGARLATDNYFRLIAWTAARGLTSGVHPVTLTQEGADLLARFGGAQ